MNLKIKPKMFRVFVGWSFDYAAFSEFLYPDLKATGFQIENILGILS